MHPSSRWRPPAKVSPGQFVVGSIQHLDDRRLPGINAAPLSVKPVKSDTRRVSLQPSVALRRSQKVIANHRFRLVDVHTGIECHSEVELTFGGDVGWPVSAPDVAGVEVNRPWVAFVCRVLRSVQSRL